jgi:hypothetical protein
MFIGHQKSSDRSRMVGHKSLLVKRLEFIFYCSRFLYVLGLDHKNAIKERAR